MGRLSLFAALAAVVGAAGCSDFSPASCSSSVDTSPSYSCMMQSVDAGGCPAIAYPEAAPGAYALGCTATFPSCSGFTQSTAAVACTCGEYDVDGGEPIPQWICPN